MNTETLFRNVVAVIATAAAVIRYALFEWEEISRAWRRTRRKVRR